MGKSFSDLGVLSLGLWPPSDGVSCVYSGSNEFIPVLCSSSLNFGRMSKGTESALLSLAVLVTVGS